MANVFVEEASLRAVADAIRGKNGGNDTYTPSEMGPAITALSAGEGGGGPTLGTATVTFNGRFAASAKGLDGFSAVTVSRDPNLHPLAYDITGGYTDGDAYYPGGSGYHSDIYYVKERHTYMLRLGGTRGNLFRAVYTVSDSAEATDTVTGTQIACVSDPAANYSTTWTAPGDGFIVITKDSVGTGGLKTYVFDISLPEDTEVRE